MDYSPSKLDLPELEWKIFNEYTKGFESKLEFNNLIQNPSIEIKFNNKKYINLSYCCISYNILCLIEKGDIFKDYCKKFTFKKIVEDKEIKIGGYMCYIEKDFILNGKYSNFFIL
jgi:hypothetical protein